MIRPSLISIFALLLAFATLSQAGEAPKLAKLDVATPPLGDISQILKIRATTCTFQLVKPVSKIQVIVDAYPRGGSSIPTQVLETGVNVPTPSTTGTFSLQIADMAHLTLDGGKDEQLYLSAMFQFGNMRAGDEKKILKKTFDITHGVGGGKFDLNLAGSKNKTPLFYMIGSPTSHAFNGISNDVSKLVDANPTATVLVVSIATE
jgi:hypothetical protein